MKLAIGTANFKKIYGVAKNIISKENNIKKILKIIKIKKIRYLDTAFDYGLIDELKELNNKNKIKIITKIKLPDKNKINFINNLEKIVKAELSKINQKSFEAVLLHNINDFKSIYAERFIKKIKMLKKKKLINKIGVSIYSPNDLKIVFLKLKPQIVQVPINILDNRIINSKWFNILKKKKIIIQARSIFLQGLLIKKISLIKKLNLDRKIIMKIVKFDNWCKINKTSRLEASLTFIKRIKGINIITVGIDSPKEILEIINILKRKQKLNFKDFSTKNLKIIDPRKW